MTSLTKTGLRLASLLLLFTCPPPLRATYSSSLLADCSSERVGVITGTALSVSLRHRLIKRSTQDITHSKWGQDERRCKRRSTCDMFALNRTFEDFRSSLSSSFTSLTDTDGHVCSGCQRNSGPVHHRQSDWKYSALTPREPSSAGFITPGM